MERPSLEASSSRAKGATAASTAGAASASKAGAGSARGSSARRGFGYRLRRGGFLGKRSEFFVNDNACGDVGNRRDHVVGENFVRRRGRGRDDLSCQLGEAVFFFGADGGENQLAEEIEAANVFVVEAERFGGEGFDESHDAPFGRKWDGDHGAGAEAAAGLGIHARIGFGIVAADGLAGAQAGAGKSGVGVELDAGVGSDASGRSAADDGIAFGEGDGDAVGASDGKGALGYGVEDFVESEFGFGRWRRMSIERRRNFSERGVLRPAAERWRRRRALAGHGGRYRSRVRVRVPGRSQN